MRRQADFLRIVRRTGAFFGQEVYADFDASISGKKPIFRAVFGLARRWRCSRTANCLALVAVLLFYPNLRQPEPGSRIFQFGLSRNNERAFERLNGVLDPEDARGISTNGEPVPFRVRLGRALAFSDIALAGAVLAARGHPNPFVHVQQTLGCAALLLFEAVAVRPGLRVVCVANDHLPTCTALLDVARRNGMRTCYIQHAPVTERFPPLDFDLAVLSDRASHQAYRRSAERHGSPETARVLILPPFETDFRPVRAPEPPFAVGVCLSLLPDLEALDELVARLAGMEQVSRVLLRRHPRCRADLSRLTAADRVVLAAGGQSPGEFFEEVGVVLVPNSGVAIEALHSGRPTFYAPGLDRLVEDYYGFVAAGILPVFDPAVLTGRQAAGAFFDREWEKRFGLYDETISTSRERAAEKVAEAFAEIARGPAAADVARQPAPEARAAADSRSGRHRG